MTLAPQSHSNYAATDSRSGYSYETAAVLPHWIQTSITRTATSTTPRRCKSPSLAATLCM